MLVRCTAVVTGADNTRSCRRNGYDGKQHKHCLRTREKSNQTSREKNGETKPNVSWTLLSFFTTSCTTCGKSFDGIIHGIPWTLTLTLTPVAMTFRGVTMWSRGGCRGGFDGTTRGMPRHPPWRAMKSYLGMPWGCHGMPWPCNSKFKYYTIYTVKPWKNRKILRLGLTRIKMKSELEM